MPQFSNGCFHCYNGCDWSFPSAGGSQNTSPHTSPLPTTGHPSRYTDHLAKSPPPTALPSLPINPRQAATNPHQAATNPRQAATNLRQAATNPTTSPPQARRRDTSEPRQDRTFLFVDSNSPLEEQEHNSDMQTLQLFLLNVHSLNCLILEPSYSV